MKNKRYRMLLGGLLILAILALLTFYMVTL